MSIFRNAGRDKKKGDSAHVDKGRRGGARKRALEADTAARDTAKADHFALNYGAGADVFKDAIEHAEESGRNRREAIGQLIEGGKGRPTPRRKDSHPVGRQSRTKTPTERALLALYRDGTLVESHPYEHGLLVVQLRRTEKGRRKAKAGRRDRVLRGMKARGKR